MAEPTQTARLPIADGDSPTSGDARIPYGTRLVMGSIGNLQGLKARLPREFPDDTERIAAINQTISGLITSLQALLGEKGQDPQSIRQALAQESANRSIGQQNKEGC